LCYLKHALRELFDPSRAIFYSILPIKDGLYEI
jgi:hypothetical protein